MHPHSPRFAVKSQRISFRPRFLDFANEGKRDLRIPMDRVGRRRIEAAGGVCISRGPAYVGPRHRGGFRDSERMVAILGIGLVTATLATCPAPEILFQRYRARIGNGWEHSYRLAGHDATTQYFAHVSRRVFQFYRQMGPLVEEWEDIPESSTHRFWNGFVGRAGPERHALIALVDEILSGDFSNRSQFRAVCRRLHGRPYSALLFEAAPGMQVELRFDQDSGDLPNAAIVSAIDGRVALSNLHYVDIDDTVIPTSWDDGGKNFRFDTVTRDDGTVVASLPIPNAPLTTTTSIKLIRNDRNPRTRGVAVQANGRDAVFMLDTGSSITAVKASLAERLQLKRIGTFGVHLPDGNISAPLSLMSIQIGPLLIKDEPVVIVPETYGYDGTIGLPLFSRADVTFGPDAVLLSPPRDVRRPNAFPIDTYDGVPIVRALVGGEDSQVLLDSGGGFEALLPARYRAHGTATLERPSDCERLGLPAWQAPFGFQIQRVQLNSMEMRVAACISQLDDLGTGWSTAVLGFPGMFGPILTVSYGTGTVLLNDPGKP